MKSILIILSILSFLSTPSDLNERATELKNYCYKNGYNTEYAILVDLGRPSLVKRLYLYDLKNEKVVMSTHAGHGSGGNSNILYADFSNVNGSHCSSLGHYKIGKERKMYTKPYMAFEVDGLDATNSNARSRSILIHPSILPLSYGCITLSPDNYDELSKHIHATSGNLIMWVYK